MVARTPAVPRTGEGKIPLALHLLELKPTPSRLMHFYSGLLLYFCSGVDTQS